MLYCNNCHKNRVTPCCGLGKDLALLSSWSTSSGVSFNAAKSAEFCIGPRVSDTGIQLDSKLISRHQTWRHLGVILSADLRWDKHINMVLAGVADKVALCQMLAFRHRQLSAVIRRFYAACIRPKLEYCSAVWCGASSSSLRCLERLQLKLAKTITRH